MDIYLFTYYVKNQCAHVVQHLQTSVAAESLINAQYITPSEVVSSTKS